MVSPHREHNQPYCSRFGTIAIELGYLSREQLRLALDEQTDDDLSGRPHRVIGAICFDHGWMTPAQIEQVLNAMFVARNQQSSLGPVTLTEAGYYLSQ